MHVVQRARHIANLDLDLDEPARLLAGDGIVGPLIRERPGLRPPGTWSPFEVGVAGDHRATGVGRCGEHGRRAPRRAARHSCAGPRATGPHAHVPGGGDARRRRLRGRRPHARTCGSDPLVRSRRRPGPRAPRSQHHARPARRFSRFPGRSRPVDRALHRAQARRARCLSDDRPRAAARLHPDRVAAAATARRSGRALATVARAGGDPPLDRRLAKRPQTYEHKEETWTTPQR